MKTKQKTEEEIVRETVEYYCNNPRALSEHGDCLYLTEDGNRCAVGRCLKKPVRYFLTTKSSDPLPISEHDLSVDDIINLDQYLKKEYRGHDSLFWRRLQVLHDGASYWKRVGKNKKVLTDEGKQWVKNKFGINI